MEESSRDKGASFGFNALPSFLTDVDPLFGSSSPILADEFENVESPCAPKFGSTAMDFLGAFRVNFDPLFVESSLDDVGSTAIEEESAVPEASEESSIFDPLDVRMFRLGFQLRYEGFSGVGGGEEPRVG